MWIKDLHLFIRKLKWKKLFANNDLIRCEELGLDLSDIENMNILTELLSENKREPGQGPFIDLKRKSTRMPPPDEYNNLDVFLQVVSEELEKVQTHCPGLHYNRSRQETEALTRLEKNKNLIFKASDKGGNLVVLDHQQYIKMVQNILSDREYYGILDIDPTDRFKTELEVTLITAVNQRLILKDECQFMTSRDPQIPTFYALPKVHKGLDPLKGRPIVSGIIL